MRNQNPERNENVVRGDSHFNNLNDQSFPPNKRNECKLAELKDGLLGTFGLIKLVQDSLLPNRIFMQKMGLA